MNISRVYTVFILLGYLPIQESDKESEICFLAI